MGKSEERLPRDERVQFQVDSGQSSELVFGEAPKGMCRYETGLKCRHFRMNSHEQSAWSLPLVPGSKGDMHGFGNELPQWGGSGIKDFDGCWRNSGGQFLLMEAKSELVGESGKRNLASIIKKLEVWIANVHVASKPESNRWTWERLSYKPLRGTVEKDWLDLDVPASRLVIVTPAVDEYRWKRLVRFIHEYKMHLQSAELWRLHAPFDVANKAKHRSTAHVHDILAASSST